MMKLVRSMTAALFAVALSTSAFAGGHSKDIVDTAVSTGTHNTLVAAVTAAGLVDALKGEGPFTVFAPVDEAFSGLPEGTVETLLKPENKDQLTAILTYHVISGKIMAADLAGTSGEAETLSDAMLPYDFTDGAMVGGAKVIAADVETSNGVIHVIDGVMLPQ